MKSKPKPDQYAVFSDALRKVVTVSHSDMKTMLDAEKTAKKKRRKRKEK